MESLSARKRHNKPANCEIAGHDQVKFPAHLDDQGRIFLVDDSGAAYSKSLAAVAEVPAGPIVYDAIRKGQLTLPGISAPLDGRMTVYHGTKDSLHGNPTEPGHPALMTSMSLRDRGDLIDKVFEQGLRGRQATGNANYTGALLSRQPGVYVSPAPSVAIAHAANAAQLSTRSVEPTVFIARANPNRAMPDEDWLEHIVQRIRVAPPGSSAAQIREHIDVGDYEGQEIYDDPYEDTDHPLSQGQTRSQASHLPGFLSDGELERLHKIVHSTRDNLDWFDRDGASDAEWYKKHPAFAHASSIIRGAMVGKNADTMAVPDIQPHHIVGAVTFPHLYGEILDEPLHYHSEILNDYAGELHRISGDPHTHLRSSEGIPRTNERGAIKFHANPGFAGMDKSFATNGLLYVVVPHPEPVAKALTHDENQKNNDKSTQADQGNQRGFITDEEIKKLGLTWITVHPPKHPEGTPILVKDNGDHYVVVGGAGGKLNQMVLPHSGKKDPEKKERKKKQEENPAEKQDPDAFARLKENRSLIQTAVKKKTAAIHEKVAGMIGTSSEGARKEAEEAAQSEATSRNLEGKDADKFVKQALQSHDSQMDAVVQRVVAHAIDRDAYRDLGIDADTLTPAQVKMKIGKRDIVKKLSEDQLQEIVREFVGVKSLQSAKKAVETALRSGSLDKVRQFQGQIEAAEPTDAQVKDWIEKNYIGRQSVLAHTALVTQSEKASPAVQKARQAEGACDAFNDILVEHTGKALLDPETIREIGVDAAAKVVAHKLATEGHDTDAISEGIAGRVSQHGYACAITALHHALDLDALADKATKAAEDGSTIAPSQAYRLVQEIQAQKFQMLNTARGGLRAASTLANEMKGHDTSAPLVLGGAGNAASAQKKAEGLGLAEGEFTVQQGKKGYDIVVPPENIAKIGRERPVGDLEGERRMSQRWKDAESNPAWIPDGLREGVTLEPWQQVGVKAMVEEKRVLLSEGPGSGKTVQYYGAAAQLLSDKKVSAVLISLPRQPRSQQAGPDGEAAKFLSPEMQENVRVITSGKELEAAVAEVKAGKQRILITSPQMMRDKLDSLKDAGFGGEGRAYYADEGHELATGSGEGEGSGMAQAYREMATSEYHAVGTGTVIDRDASELHSLVNAIRPGALGDREEFSTSVRRAAQSSGTNVLGKEALSRVERQLNPFTVSYHAPPTVGEGAEKKQVGISRGVETVPLSSHQKEAIEQATNRSKLKLKAAKTHDERSAEHLRHHQKVMEIIHGGVWHKNGMVYTTPTKGAEHVNPLADRAAEIAGEEKGRGGKTGFFSDHLRPLEGIRDRLGQKGHSYAEISGESSDKEVSESRKQINEGDADALTFTRAGYAGLNLQGLSHIVMMGADSLPSGLTVRQVEGRSWRKGQKKDVRSTTLISDDPREQQLYFRMSSLRAPQLKLMERVGLDQSALSSAVKSDDSGLALSIASNIGDVITAAKISDDELVSLGAGGDSTRSTHEFVSPFGKSVPGSEGVWSLGRADKALTNAMGKCHAIYDFAGKMKKKSLSHTKHREEAMRGMHRKLGPQIREWFNGEEPLHKEAARKMLTYLKLQSGLGKIAIERKAASASISSEK